MYKSFPARVLMTRTDLFQTFCERNHNNERRIYAKHEEADDRVFRHNENTDSQRLNNIGNCYIDRRVC